MIQGGFFDSQGGDRRYTSDDLATMFKLLITNGVYSNPTSSLQVVSGSNMTVSVNPGFGMINGRYAYNTNACNVTLTNASGTYPRIDRIVLRQNMTDRKMQIVSITGTAAASPVAPVVVRDGTFYDLSLATISVAKGATVITQAMITDTRANNAVCGYITGAVDQINTEGLFAQYEAQWLLLKALCEQDQPAILAAISNITAVSTVCGKAPDINKNIALELSDVETNTVIFNGVAPANTEFTLSSAYTNFRRLIFIHSNVSTYTYVAQGIIETSALSTGKWIATLFNTNGSTTAYEWQFSVISPTKFTCSSTGTTLKLIGVK